MKKFLIVALAGASLFLTGCLATTGGGGGANSKDPWEQLGAQKFNDPAATQIRWQPSDLNFSKGKSVGDLNAVAVELAYGTNFKSLVEWLKQVPAGTAEARQRMRQLEARGGHFGGDPAQRFGAKLAHFSREGDLSNQIWLHARDSWGLWEFWLQENARGAKVNLEHVTMTSQKRNAIHTAGAWVVLYIAHQHALGNRAAGFDHLGEAWAGETMPGEMQGANVLDNVGCGQAAWTAWLTASLRTMNFRGMDATRAGTVKSSYFHKTGGWPAAKCEAFVENWPEFTQLQIKRFQAMGERGGRR